MPVAYTILIESKEMLPALTNQYESPSNTKTFVDSFTAANYTGSTGTIVIYLVPPSGTAGNDNILMVSEDVAAGDTLDLTEIIGKQLAPGGTIQTSGTASTFSINACGRQLT